MAVPPRTDQLCRMAGNSLAASIGVDGAAVEASHHRVNRGTTDDLAHESQRKGKSAHELIRPVCVLPTTQTKRNRCDG